MQDIQLHTPTALCGQRYPGFDNYQNRFLIDEALVDALQERHDASTCKATTVRMEAFYNPTSLYALLSNRC